MHIKKKKIGLSVCDLKSFNNLKDLNFDFYKLLGIAINNKELIDILKKKINQSIFHWQKEVIKIYRDV